MNDFNEFETPIKIAVMYYCENKTQQEIAKELGITRQSVSKYLEIAKERGMVEIRVKNPLEELADLESELVSRFPNGRFKRAIIVPGTFSDTEIARHFVSVRGAQYLKNVLVDSRIKSVGISWGRTVYDMIQNLETGVVDSRAAVVPLLGSTENSAPYFMVNEMARTFANKINGTIKQVFLPLDAETHEDYLRYTETKQYERLVELWKNLDLAVVGIGTDPRRIENRRSFYPRENDVVTKMKEKFPVGDVCTRYFDVDGNILSRTEDFLITARGDAIAKIPRVIALAGGFDKVSSIKGALCSGMITDLVTDETTARAILFN